MRCSCLSRQGQALVQRRPAVSKTKVIRSAATANRRGYFAVRSGCKVRRGGRKGKRRELLMFQRGGRHTACKTQPNERHPSPDSCCVEISCIAKAQPRFFRYREGDSSANSCFPTIPYISCIACLACASYNMTSVRGYRCPSRSVHIAAFPSATP